MSYTVVQKHEKETNHGKWTNLKSSNEFTKGKQNYLVQTNHDIRQHYRLQMN